MKASIDATGKLKVSAETELESFALDQWFKLYDARIEHTGASQAILQIETNIEKTGTQEY